MRNTHFELLMLITVSIIGLSIGRISHQPNDNLVKFENLEKIPESNIDLNFNLPANNNNNIKKKVEEEKTENSYVIGMLTQAFQFFDIKSMIQNLQNGRATPGACITCRAVMGMVKYSIKYGNGFSTVASTIKYFCKTFDVQTARVCQGYIDNFLASAFF